MLTPFDDYPIHPGADPVAHPASGDPNHYDRYFFNGQDRDGRVFLAGAMGHYPNRGVVDAAFSVVTDGVEHSLFASGRMPLDRSTVVGPLEVQVLEPLRTLRLLLRPAEGMAADLTFRARTVAVEEPRQRLVADDGVILTDHTRLTQWGNWEGSVTVDGTEIAVDPRTFVGTRDRSWGVRPVGSPAPTNRVPGLPQLFWLWAPIHFDDVCSHMALHEHEDGSRWLETAMVVPTLGPGDDPSAPTAPTAAAAQALRPRELRQLRYELDFVPGRREARAARLSATDPEDGTTHQLELETLFTFRMRGIGYTHPVWGHGSNHGELEVGRESLALADFDPLDVSSLHLQNVVRARLGDREGVGVLEQFHLGPHRPTGLTRLLDGWTPPGWAPPG